MPAGLASTYDLNVGEMLDIEDAFFQLDPTETPLTGTYGAEGRSALAKGPCFETKISHLEDTLLHARGELTAAATAGATTLDVEDALRWTIGDVILVDDEYVRVTATDTGADQLTVTRGYGSSTGAAHDSGDELVGVGMSLPEGSDPDDFRSVDRTLVDNFTQIFGPHKIETTGTMAAVRKYGLNAMGVTEHDYQLAKKLREAAVRLEQAILYGERNNDAGNKRRTMGGLAYYIGSGMTDDTTTEITETALLNGLQAIYNAGGNPNRVSAGATQKRNISGFDEGQIRYDRVETQRGQTVEAFDSDFGRVSVLLNRYVRTQDLFAWDRDQVEVATLRPLIYEALAKTGDSKKGQIVCEKSLRFHRASHAYRWKALV